MKLVATKRLHYPSGPAGKEYAPGDPFDALSERDAKALKLVGKAKDAPAGPTTRRKAVTADLPPEVMNTTAPAPAYPPEGHILPEKTQIPVPGRSDYKRRDLKAEE